jgi:DNA-binding NtrC family response regulator
MGNADVAVLVVEDEPLLLMDAVDFLEEAGFAVVTARNAQDAIRTLEMRSDIRVLFVDADVQGSMDGIALAHAVRGRWPPTHIVITSGYRRPPKLDLPIRGVFLEKPYRREAVVGQIERMTA